VALDEDIILYKVFLLHIKIAPLENQGKKDYANFSYQCTKNGTFHWISLMLKVQNITLFNLGPKK